MRLKFNQNNIKGLLFSDTTQKLCEKEAERIKQNLNGKRVRKEISVKRTRYGVAVFQTCVNRTALVRAKREMLNALR